MFSIKNLEKESKILQKTIVFPEALFSVRTLRAVEIILKKRLAKVILLGEPNQFVEKSKKLRNAIIIDPKTSELKDELAALLFELRKEKGMTKDQANELLNNNFYFATLLVKAGYADGVLSGAETPSSDVIRPALQIIKAKPGLKTISSCFIISNQNGNVLGRKGPLVLSDCALNICPNAVELKDIVLATCETARTLCHISPKVALLSYSSFGSGKDDDQSILKMREALSLVRQADKGIEIDGEMQLDCAIVPEVAKIKSHGSQVAGQANVLIFPDLNCGNICYKAIQRFGKLNAIGVIMQGLDKPVNDLSRGCSVQDIVTMACITSIQANS